MPTIIIGSYEQSGKRVSNLEVSKVSKELGSIFLPVLDILFTNARFPPEFRPVAVADAIGTDNQVVDCLGFRRDLSKDNASPMEGGARDMVSVKLFLFGESFEVRFDFELGDCGRRIGEY